MTNREIRRKLERDLKKSRVNLDDIHYSLKYDLNKSQLKTLINSSLKSKIEEIFSYPFCKSYADIGIGNISEYTNKSNFITELNWLATTIITFKNQINLFILYKQQYYNYLYRGEYSKAQIILSKIEAEISISIWTIEQNILIGELSEGLIGNKSVLNNLGPRIEKDVIRFLAQMYSLRIESTLPLYEYNKTIYGYINLFTNSEDIALGKYLKYKLDGINSFEEDKAALIRYEGNASIIDRYISFVDIISTKICEHNLLSAELENIRLIVEDVLDQVKDKYLYNCYLELGGTANYFISEEIKQFNELIDTYTEGRYDEVVLNAPKYILEYPEYTEIVDIYIKSIIFLGQEIPSLWNDFNPLNTLMISIFHVYMKGNDVNEHLVSLQKLSYTWGTGTWSIKIKSILAKSYSEINDRYNVHKKAMMYSIAGNPMMSLYYIDKEQSLKYLNNIQAINKSITYKFWHNQLSIVNKIKPKYEIKIDNFRQDYYSSEISVFKNDPEHTLNLVNEILDNVIYENEIKILLNYENLILSKLNALIKLNKYNESVTLIVENNLLYNSAFFRLKNEVIIKEAKNYYDQSLSSTIDVVILLHLYREYSVERITNDDIWVAYDNFLADIDIKFPHEIKGINIEKAINKNSLVYFLKYICVKEIMGSSYNDYTSENDLDLERIAVCTYLFEIDEENAKQYIEEIISLSSEIEIRKGLKTLDESKIYVDESGIKSLSDKLFKENFNRVIELSKLRSSNLQHIIDESIFYQWASSMINENYMKKLIEKDSRSILNRFVNASQSFNTIMYDLYSNLFLRVRDLFVLNGDYGLDSYVSMRIRHGALSSHIRSVFETAKLVTIQSHTNNEYENNNNWTTDEDSVSEDELERLFGAFNTFSGRVDEINENLVNKKVQVSTEEKKTDGLFTYIYNQRDLEHLFKVHLFKAVDYDQFFTLAIDELWNQTQFNLKNIRSWLMNSTLNSLLLELHNLRSSVSDILYKNVDIRNNIRHSIDECEIKLRQEFEHISEWFKRTQSKNIEEFAISLSINVCVSIIKKTSLPHFNFTPSVKINSDILINGNYFIQLNDLFRNLIENTRHSLLTNENLKVSIDVKSKDNNLFITIKNNLSSFVDMPSLKRRVTEINEEIETFSKSFNKDSIRVEGKSGFRKIYKLIKVDLARKEFYMKVEINDENNFCVLIDFDTKGLIKK